MKKISRRHIGATVSLIALTGVLVYGLPAMAGDPLDPSGSVVNTTSSNGTTSSDIITDPTITSCSSISGGTIISSTGTGFGGDVTVNCTPSSGGGSCPSNAPAAANGPLPTGSLGTQVVSATYGTHHCVNAQIGDAAGTAASSSTPPPYCCWTGSQYGF